MNLCNGTRELHKEIVKLPDQHSAKVRPIALEELNKKVHEKAMQLSRCVSLVSLHLPFHVTRAWEHPFQKKNWKKGHVKPNRHQIAHTTHRENTSY